MEVCVGVCMRQGEWVGVCVCVRVYLCGCLPHGTSPASQDHETTRVGRHALPFSAISARESLPDVPLPLPHSPASVVTCISNAWV